jgi:iron complex transport system substrate-binding protein
MRTKNKMVVLTEIAVVLCSLFLVALPVISADQNTQKISAAEVTTASEDDFVLDIYGNANEDDTIDMRDVTYTKLIIFGKKSETELADAYYDDEVDVLDVVQVKLIILGRESELTVVDSADRIVTVSMPVESVVPLHMRHAGTVCVLGAGDRVVGADSTVIARERLFPELSKLPPVGTVRDPDIEQILLLNPDLILTFTNFPGPELLEDKLPATIPVIRFDLSRVDYLKQEMKALGYMVGMEEVNDYLEWYDGYVGTVKERVSGIPEEDKVRVFMERERIGGSEGVRWAYTSGTGYSDLCDVAGGINIAKDYIEYHGNVEVEWVLGENPDVITGLSYSGGYEVDDPAGFERYYEEIISLPGFEAVPAVENNRVHIISGDFSIGPQLPIGVVTVAKWLYPEKFSDLDTQEIHHEFLTEFMRIDYDLDEWGVFVYPESS